MRRYHDMFKPVNFTIHDKVYSLESIDYTRILGEPVEVTIKARMAEGREFEDVSLFDIEKVIFNDPATIVFWADGTKTVVKCGEEDVYDYQTGLLMCIAKKAFGNKGKFNDILREWIPEEEEKPSPTAYTFDISPADFENNSVLKLLFGGNADA